MNNCDHKFIDSKCCLKCGWEPPPKAIAARRSPMALVDAPSKKRVIIESPFGRRVDGTPCSPAEIERNTRYVRRAVADSLRRGEAPFASHALYPLVLDDATPAERRMGMEAGFAWGEAAHLIAVYADHDVTDGMVEGFERHKAAGIPFEYRYIGAEPEIA